MDVIVQDDDFIGGERAMNFAQAMTPENFEKLANGFGVLIETLVEKGVLTLEDCGPISGRYWMRKAGA